MAKLARLASFVAAAPPRERGAVVLCEAPWPAAPAAGEEWEAAVAVIRWTRFVRLEVATTARGRPRDYLSSSANAAGVLAP